ncbi:MAG: aminotransferase class V-fold PLP-dependent enzyme [bacterium]|nr:aminotransferase class V-fold PLP-dependent enzyme [bacterium]
MAARETGIGPLNHRPHAPDLDLTFVRGQFPAFSEPSLEGWAFFENAGGSYTCRQVIDRLTAFYTRTKVQPYYPYPTSEAAGAAMDEAYEQFAGYLNVGVDEVHLGPSTSQNTYVLERALRSLWREGDEIVVSNQDHEANAGAWRRLADTGIVVKEWEIDPETGVLDLADLDRLLTKKTRMVAFPHCSNVVAAINPVAEIAARAHAAGAITVIDGVAWAPHGLPDVGRLGADIYLFSLYKTWGPHLGLMTVKRELLDAMSNQGHFFNAGHARKRLLPAGPDHAQIAAASGVCEYLDAVYEHHFDEPADPAERGRRVNGAIRVHETRLLGRLLEWLRDRDDLRIVGPDDPRHRGPTVSVLPLTKEPEDLVRALAEHKLMTGCGHFYGVRPLAGMDIDTDPGVLRLSFLHYTTEDEIDQLIAGLEAALA